MKASMLALSLFLAPFLALASTAELSTASIQPVEAIQLAAASAPNGVPGSFAVYVKATGFQDGFVYLNSESDYRDQRCLTIAITPDAARALRVQLGADVSVALKGKNIVVTGEATRVTVWLTHRNGKRTDKYYYQTHVKVVDPNQIQVASGGG
jgi:predicted S18 family serine protease